MEAIELSQEVDATSNQLNTLIKQFGVENLDEEIAKEYDNLYSPRNSMLMTENVQPVNVKSKELIVN